MQEAANSRRFQFSLKALLLVVTAAGLGCAIARLIGWDVACALLFAFAFASVVAMGCSAGYWLWQQWQQKQEKREKRREQQATRALLELAGVALGDERSANDRPNRKSPNLEIPKPANRLPA